MQKKYLITFPPVEVEIDDDVSHLLEDPDITETVEELRNWTAAVCAAEYIYDQLTGLDESTGLDKKMDFIVKEL